jgi:sulfide dehydrogenase cytochrome subunit
LIYRRRLSRPPPSFGERNALVFARIVLVAFLLIALGRPVAAAPADVPAGAVSCSGCHPIGKGVATPVPRLIGRDAGEIAAAMRDFRSGQRPATVMDRIAKGFTDDESAAIAAWIGAQKD